MSILLKMLLLASVPGIGMAFAEGSTFVNVGDAGSIQFPVANYGGSVLPLQGVRVSTSGPSYFNTLGTSDLGPATIPPGAMHTFRVDYEIGATAADGDFNVILNVTVSSPEAIVVPTSLPPSTTITLSLDTQPSSGLLRNSLGATITQSSFTDTQCIYHVAVDTPSSGIHYLWKDGGSTVTFSVGMTSAVAGPYCGLSQGVHHFWCEDWAGNQSETVMTASSEVWKFTLAANATASGGWSGSDSEDTTASDIQTNLLRFWVYAGGNGVGFTCENQYSTYCPTIHTIWGGQEKEACECTTYGAHTIYGEQCPYDVCVFHVFDATAPATAVNFIITNKHETYSVVPISFGTRFVGSAGTFLSVSTYVMPGQQVLGSIVFPQVPQQTYEIVDSTLTVEAPFNWLTVLSTSPTLAQQIAMPRQGLRLISPDLQSITAEGASIALTSTMTLAFQFASAQSTPTASIRRFDGTNWESGSIMGLSVSKIAGVITAIGHSSHTSVYGVFIDGVDTSSPTTTFSIIGSSYSWNEVSFVSTGTYIVFTATDSLQDGYASGVSTIYYRASAADDFSVYTDSIPLSVGTYFFQYHTSDWAGNLEPIKTSTFVITDHTATQLSAGLRVVGDMSVGVSTAGARFGVESGGFSKHAVRISSSNDTAIATVDFIGNFGLGTGGGAGRLSISSNAAQGDIALQLRSGNSTGSVISSQFTLGYNGDSSMRDVIRTQHNAATAGNRMDFLVWEPSVGSTGTLANLDVMSLEASTVANRALVHIRPTSTRNQDVELIVSNGDTEGGGIVRCKETVGTSAKESKDSIRYLSAKDEDRALEDVASLHAVRFRYKRHGSKGELIADPSQPLRRGYVFEDAPGSIKAAGGALSIDERIANAEMALKAAMRRLEKLQKRYAELQARKKK